MGVEVGFKFEEVGVEGETTLEFEGVEAEFFLL